MEEAHVLGFADESREPVCDQVDHFDADHGGHEEEVAALVEHEPREVQMVRLFHLLLDGDPPVELHVGQRFLLLLQVRVVLYGFVDDSSQLPTREPEYTNLPQKTTVSRQIRR